MFGNKSKEPTADEVVYLLKEMGLVVDRYGYLETDYSRVNKYNQDCRIPVRLKKVESVLSQVVSLLKEAGIVEDVPCECGSGVVKLRLNQKREGK